MMGGFLGIFKSSSDLASVICGVGWSERLFSKLYEVSIYRLLVGSLNESSDYGFRFFSGMAGGILHGTDGRREHLG